MRALLVALLLVVTLPLAPIPHAAACHPEEYPPPEEPEGPVYFTGHSGCGGSMERGVCVVVKNVRECVYLP